MKIATSNGAVDEYEEQHHDEQYNNVLQVLEENSKAALKDFVVYTHLWPGRRDAEYISLQTVVENSQA